MRLKFYGVYKALAPAPRRTASLLDLWEVDGDRHIQEKALDKTNSRSGLKICIKP